MVGAPDFESQGLRSKSHFWRQNSAHFYIAFCCTKPFILTLALPQYDFKNVKPSSAKKLHLKMSSAYVVCCIFLQTFQTYILHIGKQ